MGPRGEREGGEGESSCPGLPHKCSLGAVRAYSNARAHKYAEAHRARVYIARPTLDVYIRVYVYVHNVYMCVHSTEPRGDSVRGLKSRVGADFNTSRDGCDFRARRPTRLSSSRGERNENRRYGVCRNAESTISIERFDADR